MRHRGTGAGAIVRTLLAFGLGMTVGALGFVAVILGPMPDGNAEELL
jgi:hypothetical protein